MTNRKLLLVGAHRIAILLFVLFALFPIFWLVKVSVTPNDLLYSEGVRLWPSRMTFDHFSHVLNNSSFPLFFRNSLIVSGSTAIIVTLLASLSGYALSRFNFRAKYWIVALMLLTQMFPLVMLIAPIYKIMAPLGLTNSLIGLIIVYSAFNVPFATFLMQSFFDGIPKELEEAAKIDGAGELRTFFVIVIPMLLPALGALAIFAFMHAWNDYLWQLVVLQSESMLTLPLGVSTMIYEEITVNYGMAMTGATIAAVPLIAFFLALQKSFIQGITLGSIKG